MNLNKRTAVHLVGVFILLQFATDDKFWSMDGLTKAVTILWMWVDVAITAFLFELVVLAVALCLEVVKAVLNAVVKAVVLDVAAGLRSMTFLLCFLRE